MDENLCCRWSMLMKRLWLAPQIQKESVLVRIRMSATGSKSIEVVSQDLRILA